MIEVNVRIADGPVQTTASLRFNGPNGNQIKDAVCKVQEDCA